MDSCAWCTVPNLERRRKMDYVQCVLVCSVVVGVGWGWEGDTTSSSMLAIGNMGSQSPVGLSCQILLFRLSVIRSHVLTILAIHVAISWFLVSVKTSYNSPQRTVRIYCTRT